MAFARSLKQLTPTLATQLLPSCTQSSWGCGLHHQHLPCALVSLAHLHTANQLHHSVLISQKHQGCLSGSNGEAYLITRMLCVKYLCGHTQDCAGKKYEGHSARQNFSLSLMHKHLRLYSSESEQADKPKYPVTTPDHVYVYNGPLAVTVTRLKVKKAC